MKKRRKCHRKQICQICGMKVTLHGRIEKRRRETKKTPFPLRCFLNSSAACSCSKSPGTHPLLPSCTLSPILFLSNVFDIFSPFLSFSQPLILSTQRCALIHSHPHRYSPLTPQQRVQLIGADDHLFGDCTKREEGTGARFCRIFCFFDRPHSKPICFFST